MFEELIDKIVQAIYGVYGTYISDAKTHDRGHALRVVVLIGFLHKIYEKYCPIPFKFHGFNIEAVQLIGAMHAVGRLGADGTWNDEGYILSEVRMSQPQKPFFYNSPELLPGLNNKLPDAVHLICTTKERRKILLREGAILQVK